MNYLIDSMKRIRKTIELNGRKGSSMVMLAIIFVGFAMCIAGAIVISRKLVVSSEC